MAAADELLLPPLRTLVEARAAERRLITGS
jgi:hypothetical protein